MASWSAQDLRLAALTLMSAGVMLSAGTANTASLLIVVAALTLLWLSLGRPQSEPRLVVWLTFALLSFISCCLYLHIYGRAETVPLALLAAGTAGGFLLRGRLTRAAGITVAVAGAVGLAAVAWTWGQGPFDVFWHVQNGAQEILQGANPYAATFYDWIPSGNGTLVHGNFHPPYGPPVYILAAPARLLGDVRLMAVLMCAVLGLALWLLAKRSMPMPRYLVLMFVCSPFLAAMVVNAWVDVYTIAGIAWWLALRDKFRIPAIVPLAIAIAIKPTNLLLLLPALIWSGALRREVIYATGIAIVIDTPFAWATGLAQFAYYTLGIQFQFPERFDALTVNAVLFLNHLPILPWSEVLGLGLYLLLLVVVPRPRDLGDLLAITVIGITMVFIFSKWAFFNYYYLSAMLILLAIASTSIPVPRRQGTGLNACLARSKPQWLPDGDQARS